MRHPAPIATAGADDDAHAYRPAGSERPSAAMGRARRRGRAQLQPRSAGTREPGCMGRGAGSAQCPLRLGRSAGSGARAPRPVARLDPERARQLPPRRRHRAAGSARAACPCAARRGRRRKGPVPTGRARLVAGARVGRGLRGPRRDRGACDDRAAGCAPGAPSAADRPAFRGRFRVARGRSCNTGRHRRAAPCPPAGRRHRPDAVADGVGATRRLRARPLRMRDMA